MRYVWILFLLVPSFARADAPANQTVSTPTPSNELSAALGFFRIQGGYNSIGAFGVGYRGIGYSHNLNNWFALSGRVRFSASANTDQSQGNSVIEVTIGPTFNIAPGSSSSFADAYFISLGFGVNYTQVNGITVPGTLYTTGALFQTNPAFSVELGKRFRVLPNLSLMPSVLITYLDGPDVITGASAATPAISFQPLAVSVSF